MVRLMNMILVDAIRRGASDIHSSRTRRCSGFVSASTGLHEIMAPPKRLEAALTSRVKIMANLDIAERRLPQDGRIKLRFHHREIDFRVSTLPTIFGEERHRILDKEALQLDMTKLGFDAWSLEQFNKAIHQSVRDDSHHGTDGLRQDHDAVLGVSTRSTRRKSTSWTDGGS